MKPLEAHFRTYPFFLRRHFGFPVSRVSIDAGFTCPNRDGKKGEGGCIFCNNESFSPNRATLSIDEQIMSSMHVQRNHKFIVYFQSYTNTYERVEKLRQLYEAALSIEGCVGLSIGTRSDCVDEEKLSMLEELAREYFVTIEYGLQSPYQTSLDWMRRGHDYDSFLEAIEMTEGRGILIGTHVILGIPGETESMMMRTASMLSELPIQIVKIHQLQVIVDTPLALLYARKPFPLWSLDEYADFLCGFIEELREDIIIQRLYSFSHPHLLVGPLWGQNRQEIDRVIHERIRKNNMIQGRRRR